MTAIKIKNIIGESIDLTNTLARVLLKIQQNPKDKKIEDVRKEGYKTAQKYNRNRTEELLLQTWQHLIR